jgi:hypothetical protein
MHIDFESTTFKLHSQIDCYKSIFIFTLECSASIECINSMVLIEGRSNKNMSSETRRRPTEQLNPRTIVIKTTMLATESRMDPNLPATSQLIKCHLNTKRSNKLHSCRQTCTTLAKHQHFTNYVQNYIMDVRNS